MSKQDFVVGEDLCWLHGDNYRIAKVLKVDVDRVYLDGYTSQYWIKNSTLLKKINKPEMSFGTGG